MSKDDNYIYFAGSIRGGRDDAELYLQIIEYLGNYGKVLTEHVGDRNIAILGEDSLTDPEIHDRDMGWLTKARKIVAEVTKASLGVGYEIGRIVERNKWVEEKDKKEILCLYRPSVDKRLSAMINGCRDVTNAEYKNFDEAKRVIDNFFK